jgi:hypothetical protein
MNLLFKTGVVIMSVFTLLFVILAWVFETTGASQYSLAGGTAQIMLVLFIMGASCMFAGWRFGDDQNE